MADSCIYEARDENILVSLKDEKSTVRIARFLKPIVRNVEQAVGVPNTPLLHELFSHSSKNWPSKVSLKGWKPPQKEWGQWVENLAGKYGAVWNQAGICDAVLSSTYEFPCNRDVILGLSEFWCPDTNTFVFPWGEVTVTLEDVLILGGFPVLGELVTMALEGDQSKKLWEEIENQRTELHKISKAKRASHGVWLEHFIEKGSDELEHVAFLCLWLSRFVFPSCSVGSRVFSIAVHLSQGKKIALAPAVLASLYHNLRLLKEQAVVSSESNSITVSGLFQLVQLWAFERFQKLAHNSARLLHPGEPRAARWHKVGSKLNLRGVKSVIKLAENFSWRPYAAELKNWHLWGFYKETEQVVFSCSSVDEDLQSFGKCLQASELVGIDGKEMYLPQRVSRQFGMDQDLPGDISYLDDFTKELDFCFYIAPASFQAGVSRRYFDWWKESMLDREKAVKYVVDNQEPSLNNVKMELLVQAEMKPTQVMTPNAATASELRYGSVSSKNEVDNQVSEAPRVQEEFDNKSQGTKSDAKESHVTICQDSLAEAKKMQQVPEDVNDDEFESLPPTKSSSLGDDDIDRKRKFSTTIEFKGEPIDVDDLSQEIEWRNGSKRDKKMAGRCLIIIFWAV